MTRKKKQRKRRGIEPRQWRIKIWRTKKVRNFEKNKKTQKKSKIKNGKSRKQKKNKMKNTKIIITKKDKCDHKK